MRGVNANTTWEGRSGTVVQVRTAQCDYRVVFHEGEAFVTAPGLELTIELVDETHPEDEELCAIMVVAQIEGGIEL